MSTICFYHSRDLDGFTSGAIIKRKFPDCKLVGYDYGQPFPSDVLSMQNNIIMVDVSLSMEQMFFVAGRVNSFTWIDHHVSAITEYNAVLKIIDENRPPIIAILENGIAACEIAWKHYYPDEHMPTAVKLLGQYDTWRNADRFNWENAVLPFQFGMRQICNSPETFPFPLIAQYASPKNMNHVESAVGSIIKDGMIILDYQAKVSELACRKGAFEYEIDGYRAICLNQGGANSDMFKSVYDGDKHDIMMPFYFNGKQWIASMYTLKEGIDVSKIAKARGGGGHAKAAGFEFDGLGDVFPLLVVKNEITG